MIDPTLRFSSRVENYIKYRPSYPAAVVDLLKAVCGLTGESVVADIGSGAGILTELFLRNGNPVFGVEPNPEMRAAGERLLRRFPRFTSVAGTAEATTLPDQSVDFITAGQSFHWFDKRRARREWQRILRSEGWVVLIWNERRTESSPFLAAYDELLRRFGTDYEKVNHTQITDEILAPFFGSAGARREVFPNAQRFDFDGLTGRLLSSSYVPEPGHPSYAPMMASLRAIYDAYQVEGCVTFDYDTNVYYGQLT
jgi:SAM-dependent methyltransferase